MSAPGIKLARERLVEHCFGFVETIQRDICVCQIVISERAIGVDLDSLLRFLDCFIELAHVFVLESRVVVAGVIPRIFLGDDLKLLHSLLKVAEKPVVMAGDIEPLRFASPPPMVESLLDVVHGKFILAQVAVNRCQGRVSDGEIRVQFDRPFEEWD